jgi:hypothetical protein
MSLIYSCAVVTIVAMSGTSANTGLPGILPTERNLASFNIAPGLSIIKRTPLESLLGSNDPFHREGYVYNTRAWTYQEFLLSNRCIVFSSEQVTLRCSEGFSYEDRFPRNTGGKLWSSNFKNWGESSSKRKARFPKSDLSWPNMYWYDSIVSQYTSRHMSVPGDVMNAFKGIQVEMTRIFGSEFTHGMPISGLDLALLWTPVKNLQRRNTNPLHPSWSWVGWIGRIHLDTMIQLHTLSKNSADFQRLGTLSLWYSNTLHVDSESVKLEAFFMEPACPTSNELSTMSYRSVLIDRQGRRCGILYSHGPRYVDGVSGNLREAEIIRLSRWRREFQFYTDLGELESTTDFDNTEWCMYNVMCVQWTGTGYNRLGIGKIHKDPWENADPIERSIDIQ